MARFRRDGPGGCENRPPGYNGRSRPSPLLVEAQWFPEVGLGLRLWEGSFEGRPGTWLRWCGRDGQVIPTGAERAERLAAQLRALGIEAAA